MWIGIHIDRKPLNKSALLQFVGQGGAEFLSELAGGKLFRVVVGGGEQNIARLVLCGGGYRFDGLGGRIFAAKPAGFSGGAGRQER